MTLDEKIKKLEELGYKVNKSEFRDKTYYFVNGLGDKIYNTKKIKTSVWLDEDGNVKSSVKQTEFSKGVGQTWLNQRADEAIDTVENLIETSKLDTSITKASLIDDLVNQIYDADHPKTTLKNAKTVISQASLKINEANGKVSIWLPSDADNIRAEHVEFYGEEIGADTNNEIPGEEYGCQCGVGYK